MSSIGGEYWLFFHAQQDVIDLYLNFSGQTNFPDSVFLYEGSCNTLIHKDEITIDEDSSFFYRVYNAQIGLEYFIGFKNNNSWNFSGLGNIEHFAIDSTGAFCGTQTPCNIISNGNFESVDQQNFVGNTRGYSPNLGIRADVGNACDWRNATIVKGGTPDYFYRADMGLDNSKFTPINLCGASPNTYANTCSNHSIHPASNSTFPQIQGDGAIHLFVLDERLDSLGNFEDTLRREYAMTRLINDINPGDNIFFFLDVDIFETDRTLQSGDIQMLFPDEALDVPLNPVNHNQAITTWGNFQVDLNPLIDNTIPTEQHVVGNFIYNETVSSNALVIGNFKDRANTVRITGTGQNVAIPSLMLDNIEIFKFETSGLDSTIRLCDSIQIGTTFECEPTNPGFTIEWYDHNGNLIPAATNQQTFTTSFTSTGVYTFTRHLTYRGQSIDDPVTITVVDANPFHFTQHSTNICDLTDASFTVNLQGFNPADFTVSVTGGNYSNISWNGSQAELNGFSITSSNKIATVSVSYDPPPGGCPTIRTFIVTDNCCAILAKADYDLIQQNADITIPPGLVAGSVISVTGTVTLNVPYIFDNCTFMLAPDAELIIPSGVNIQMLNNTTLEACNNYKWDRVLVDPGATLEMDQCHIENAVRGIMTSQNNSVQITNSYFEFCYTGAIVKDYNANNFIYRGNTFIGDGLSYGLPIAPTSPLQTNWSRPTGFSFLYTTGIILDNSTNMYIGDASNVNYKNTFDAGNNPSYADGLELNYILAVNSEFTVKNNDFGLCYYAIHSVNSFQTIGGTSTNEANTFDALLTTGRVLNGNIGTALWTTESTGAFNQNFVDNYGNGVSINTLAGPTSLYPGSLRITEMVFNGGEGVRMTQGVNPSKLYINENTITGQYGITIENALSNATNRVKIHNNTININPVNGWGTGIDIRNSSDVWVFSNPIECTISHTPNSSLKAIGVRDLLSDSKISNQPTIKGFDAALLIEGNSQDGIGGDPTLTEFWCNTFLDSYYGVYYKNVSEIADVFKPLQFLQHLPIGKNSSDNVFVNILNANRVRDNLSQPISNPKFWYFNNGNPSNHKPYIGTSGPSFVFIGENPGNNISQCDLPSTARNEQKKHGNTVAEIKIKATPNPSSGDVKISVSGIDSLINISITNSVGQLVLKKDQTPLKAFELSQLPTGVYLITIESKNKRSVEKIIIH